MLRKLLQQRSARFPIPRRRLKFEPLEPRILLSADLTPLEGVLSISGTDGDDFLLLRELEPQPGSAPTLLVVLNDESFVVSLERIDAIKVELGGGGDSMVLEGSSALPAVQIDLGEGDNNLSAVLRNPDGVLDVAAGAGKDTIDAHSDWTGSSVDDHPDFLWAPTFFTGAGDDVVDFSAVMGIEPQPFIPHVKLEATIDTGDGDDVLGLDSVTGGETSDAVYRVRMGDGDNETSLRFGDGVHGARLPSGESNVRAEYRSGEGTDTVSVDYKMFLADGTPVRARALDLDVLTGGGSDTVEVEVGQADQEDTDPVAALDLAVRIDTGAGEDTTRSNVFGIWITTGFFEVDTGSGDDRLAVKTSDVVLAEGAKVEWLYDLGAGDDDGTHIRAGWEIGTGVDYRWAVGLGDGDDSFKASVDGQRVGQGASVAYEFSGGAGDDEIAISLTNLALAESAAFAMKTAAGDGDDLVRHEIAHVLQQTGGTQPPPDDIKPAEFFVNAGAGVDALIVDMGGDANVAGSFKNIQGEDSETQVVEFQEGDDAGLRKKPGRIVMTALEELTLETGLGTDRIRIEIEDPAAPVPALSLRTGGGDDTVSASYDFPRAWPVKWKGPTLKVDTDAGNDVVDVGLVMGIEPEPFSPEVDLDIRTGDGDDSVNAALLLPAVQAAREVVSRTNIDLGGGNDTVVVGIDTTDPASGINPCVLVGIDAGLGGDSVAVNARGAFEEFDLRVDLGPDTSGDVLPTEQLSLNFEEIKAEYRVQSHHEYTPKGGSGSVQAEYHVGVRSDGELVQAVQDVETIGGLVADQVNVEIGGNRTETVGANMVITVGGSQTESVDDGLAADYSLFTRLGAGDGASIEGEVQLKGAPGDTGFALDLGANEVPTRAGFANVTGITSEITPAEYRAGAELGDDLTLNIDMSGVDAVNLITGDANDEIDIDLLYPAFPVPTLTVKSGGGNDSVGGTIIGQAGPLKITLGTGDGHDRVNLDYTEAAAIVTGAGMGGLPHVKAFSGASSAEGHDFLAYSPQFTGGVRVAVGDVNGDGVQDIVTGTGPGGGPHVKVFDGRTGAELRSFFAYDPGFTGGVYVAAGDVNGDGYADIVTGADAGGGPHVRVFSGDTGAELRSFFAYSPDFLGGVRVATGDINDDGFDDIITASGPGGGPHVRVFDGLTGAATRGFFAYDPSFTGGVFVAAGDVDGDGLEDIITGADAGGGPHVKVFSGATGAELRSFFAYAASFSGGVRVAAGDVNGDGLADVVTGAGPGGGPHVKVFDGSTGAEVRSFFAYDPSFTGGVYVAAGDVNSDASATFDLAVDTGDGNDDVTLDFATGGSRADRIDAELGDGADRFALRWSGALQEPSVDLAVEVHVDPGGTGFLPEVEDEVLVSFEHGALNRPFVIGALWNSKDNPPPDDETPPPDDQHLLMSLSSTGGVLSSSTEILGGAGSDEATYFVSGRLNAATAGPISASIDLGDGADSMTINFTGLEMEGPKKLAPISLDLRGGTGRDTLAFTGTERNDKFTLTERSILLEGAANANFAGFEVVQVYALGGNDRVTMTGFTPRIDWLVDGGDGHDRFRADFDIDRNPMLVNFEKVKLKKGEKRI